MATRRPIKADPFDVWGAPPQALARGMTQRQMNLLRRYVEAVTRKSYRLGLDNGVSQGLSVVMSAAQKEWRKQLGAR